MKKKKKKIPLFPPNHQALLLLQSHASPVTETTQVFRKNNILSSQDFPGVLAVKTLPSNARGEGLIPGQGDKVPHTRKPKLETSSIGTNSIKSLKMIHIKDLYKKNNHIQTLLNIK